MITLKSVRNACLFILIVSPLVACSQQSNDLEQLNAHLEVAELYREQGQFRASIIELQNAFQLEPENEATLLLLARLYLDIGDTALAIRQLETANENTPNNPETILLLSDAYIIAGKQQEASFLLAEFELPLDADVEMKNHRRLLSAKLHIADNNSQEAISLLETILSSGGKPTDALILLSKIEYQAGNVDSASAYTDEAIAFSSDNLNLWIWRGQFALLQQDYAGSETAFYEALDIMSLYDVMTSKKFTVLQSVLLPLQMQQKNDEALRFSELIASTPQGEFNSSYSNALTIFQGGDMAEAEQAFNEILASTPDHAGSNILLGITKYAQGDFNEAATLLDQYVDIENASPELIKTMAATHLKLNNPEKSLSILNEAIKNYPDDPSLLAAMALSYQTLGNSEEAIVLFNRSLDAEPESLSVLLALAVNYSRVQNFPDAIETLNKAIVLNPSSIQAKSQLIDIYIQQNQLDLARDQLQTWVSQEPDSILNNALAGLVAFQSKAYDEARDFFNKVISLDEGNIQARLNLAKIDILEEKYLDAEVKYRSILEQDINNVTALSAILAIGQRRNNTEASVASFQALIADNPLEYTPPLVLSRYFVQTNEIDRALEYAEEAFKLNSNINTQNSVIEINARLARMSAQEGDYQQVRSYVKRIQEIRPDAASSYEIEADFLMSQNEIDSSLEIYQKAWEIEESSELGVKLYRIYSSLERPQDATAFLNEWIASQPDSASANLLTALEYQLNNQDSDAIRHYELVYQQQPNNLIALNNLAWLYREVQPEKALELSLHAVDLYPENSDVLDTYGWILVQQDKHTEAIVYLEKALALAPESEEIIEHLSTARAGQ